MNKKDCITAFNTTLYEFSQQLASMFPTSSFLKSNQNNLSMMVRISPIRPSLLFFEELHPLTTSIMTKDVGAFRVMMDHASSRKEKTNVFALLQYMHSIWDNPQMTETSKDNVWKYMILMMALANKIHKN